MNLALIKVPIDSDLDKSLIKQSNGIGFYPMLEIDSNTILFEL